MATGWENHVLGGGGADGFPEDPAFCGSSPTGQVAHMRLAKTDQGA